MALVGIRIVAELMECWELTKSYRFRRPPHLNRHVFITDSIVNSDLRLIALDTSRYAKITHNGTALESFEILHSYSEQNAVKQYHTSDLIREL